MLEHVRNLLYRKPELYESVYPEPNGEKACLCRRMFQRFLGRFPASVLDIGCGTGRDLAGLSVGSRSSFEGLVQALEQNHLRPVIDRSFPISQLREALEYLSTGQHVGKIVIDFEGAW